MSEVIKIKKGLDIQLLGKAEKIFGQADLPEHFAIRPADFHVITSYSIHYTKLYD